MALRIFFDIQSKSRGRLWETLRHPPKGIEFVAAQTRQIADYKLMKEYKRPLFKNMLVPLLKRLPVIHLKYITDRRIGSADGIYSHGALILNNKPYIIELDNVASLVYYNPSALRNRVVKWVLRMIIKDKNCRKLICISEAARKSVTNTFRDSEIAGKCEVVYPYVALNRYKKGKSDKIRILFNSTQFYLKGGRELLEAFKVLEGKFQNIELWIVSNTPPEIRSKYSSENIKFVEAKLSKEELYRDYYSQADIFVHATYQDSFGLVVLEALAAGLPVVATDMFAIPEMVEDGKNGFLIKSPIQYFNDDFTPNIWAWGKDLDVYAKKHEFPDVVEKLVEKLSILISNKRLRERMGRSSKMLVKEGKFSEATREKRLREVLESAFN